MNVTSLSRMEMVTLVVTFEGKFVFRTALLFAPYVSHVLMTQQSTAESQSGLSQVTVRSQSGHSQVICFHMKTESAKTTSKRLLIILE